MRSRGSKFFYIFGAALILIFGIYFFSNYSKTGTTIAVKDQQVSNVVTTPSSEEPKTPETSTTEKPTTESAKPSPDARFSDESDIEGEHGHDILVSQVDYDGNFFTPSLINIKAGDIVIFKNNSGKDFWPASGPHPSHALYPGFDAKKKIGPGETFEFKFTKVGKWSYHDHLNESVTGAINVTK